MGYYGHHVVLCEKCKMKSDVIDVKNGRYVEGMKDFYITSFIKTHIGCCNLVIKEIAHELCDDFEIYDHFLEYTEDLDLCSPLGKRDVLEELREYNHKAKIVEGIRKKLFTKSGVGWRHEDYCTIKMNDYIRKNKSLKARE